MSFIKPAGSRLLTPPIGEDSAAAPADRVLRVPRALSPALSHLERLLAMVKHSTTKIAHLDEGKHRTVYTVGDKYVLKKNLEEPDLDAFHKEVIAYQVSEQLKFFSIPYTAYLPDKSIPPALSAILPDAVRNAEIIQLYIPPSPAKPQEVNPSSAQRALFLSWILGRFDSHRGNSVVTTEGELYEIDNDAIGAPFCDCFYKSVINSHWVERKIDAIEIDPELVKQTLSFTPITLEEPTHYAVSDDLVSKISKSINENLALLQETLSILNRKQEMTTIGSIKSLIEEAREAVEEPASLSKIYQHLQRKHSLDKPQGGRAHPPKNRRTGD